MALPLGGLRVLDLSRVLAGPWATMLLGDAGAHVVKVERPVTGDDTRSWGPPFLPPDCDSTDVRDGRSVSSYFLSVNRSKRSVAIDLKTEEGRALCRRLATEWADVLVENFKVGAMDRWGLGYDSLRERNPGLIYCGISGFGTTGPLRDRPGYDVIVSGMYGLMSITGDERGDPAKVGVAITDVLTGTLANSGILAALHQRQKTGLGQRVDASLMETQLACLVNIASSSLNAAPNNPPPKRWGTSHESIVPYQTFRCKPSSSEGQDEFIVVGAGNDVQFKRFCEVLDLKHLASDERFQTNASRVANRDKLVAILEEKFSNKSRDEWMTLLDGNGFALGPVRTVPEAFKCKQAQHREMVSEMDHVIAGRIRLPRHPLTYSGQQQSLAWKKLKEGKEWEILPPPMLGEHTEEVLREMLGVSVGELERLEREGVVQCWRQGE
mmetsp:Transcript_12504/g.25971  ORF Transcript_12504/g.25971 Transcript_12504/m.25971 type:complete len:439 (-) Transcript_12504:10-1326(-)